MLRNQLIEKEQQESKTRTSMHLPDPAPEGAKLSRRDGMEKGEKLKELRMPQHVTCPEQGLQPQHQAETCSVVIYCYCGSSPALLSLLFTRRKSWQAVGQAYILLKQKGPKSHLPAS